METNKKTIPIVDRLEADAARHETKTSVSPNEVTAELRILAKGNNACGVRKLVAAFVKWEASVSAEMPDKLRARVLSNLDFACRVADVNQYGSGEITNFYREAIGYSPHAFQKK